MGDLYNLKRGASSVGDMKDTLASVTFTIGTEAANAINVAMQFNDYSGSPLAVRSSVFVYLSDDANGDSVAGTAPDGGVAVGTDGLAIPLVAAKAFQCTSESDGDLDLTITESGVDTWYVVVVLPSGELTVSGAVTFA